MDFFKIKDMKDYPLDERDHPLDELDLPLAMDIQAEFDLERQFGLSDADYDSIDNISPIIDKQMQDTAEVPEDGQYDEFDDLDLPLDDAEPEEIEDQDMDLNPEEETEVPEDDPNFQGVIRTVKGANLVYKRQNETNTFDELWIMNVGKDMKKESQIKRAILAGTDLDAQTQESQDGKQNMELFTIGNVQFIALNGLPQ